MREFLKNIHINLGNFLFSTPLRTNLAIMLAISPLALIPIAYKIGPPAPASITVMITNFQGTSGGSGVIIKNSKARSLILTNAHVCRLVSKAGGLVRQNGENYFVTGTLPSKNHDLCILSVAADLNNSVKVATKPPELYEEAIISGHPALLPDIISKGQFGGKQIVQIMTGLKPCTKEDTNGPLGLLCMLAGGLPVITTYESRVVSALIQGGSSGSAVLNSKGELAGLVFAGSGNGLSYASIVPYEYVLNFLFVEFKESNLVIPNPEMVLGEPSSPQRSIREGCKSPKLVNPKIKEICRIVGLDTLYYRD
jgi:S1-C subfamily serine protease